MIVNRPIVEYLEQTLTELSIEIYLNALLRSSHHGSVVANPASIHEDMGSISGAAQWVKDSALPGAVV